MNRRTLLKTGTSVLGASAFGLPSIGRAADGFDWKQCKGQTVVVTMSKNPRADTLQKYQREFEELTGIKVESEQMPEQQQRSKAILELSTGRPSFDVFHYSLHVSKRIVGNGKWLEDLRPYVANPNLTAPDFDFADFSKPSVEAATQPDGAHGFVAARDGFLVDLLQQGIVRPEGCERFPPPSTRCCRPPAG